jgi:hypothetical protein
MMQKAIRALLALGVVILLLSSCHSEPSSAELANQVKNLGVYASTGTELIEVSAYGEEQLAGFWFKDAAPKVPSVAYFLVNMPNADIGDSKIFWMYDLQTAAKWSDEEMATRSGPKLVKTNIEGIGHGLYKITPTEKQSAGFICLLLKMPPGVPDRLYAVQFGK